MESTSFIEITAFQARYRTMQFSHVRSPESRDRNGKPDVRLNTDGEQLFNRVLSRFGFHFTCCRHVRHQRQVHEQRVLTTNIYRQLTNRFEEWQGFDIPTVPPISTSTTSCPSPPARTRSLMALVMCGMTCTVAPGSHHGALYAERQSRYDQS